MTAATFAVAGIEVVADLSGALVVPSERTLVVADLHLEKGSSLARAGALLPPYDSRATLAALGRTVAAYRPERVVCLGDSFHDAGGPGRLRCTERADLGRLTGAVDWVWVAGNHDGVSAGDLGGRTVSDLVLGPLVFRHEAAADPALDGAEGEVSGHFHPRASVLAGGRRLSARCFVTDGRRLILPSFGAFTGGLDVFHPAIRGLFGPAFTAHLLGRSRVHSLSGEGLHGGRSIRTRPDHVPEAMPKQVNAEEIR